MDPGKLKGIRWLANPYNSQTNPRIFRIWELLPTIHLAFFGAGKTTEWSPKKRSNIWMDRWLPESIWRIEEAIYWRTSLNDARPKSTIPDQNRCLQICNWGSSHSVGLWSWDYLWSQETGMRISILCPMAGLSYFQCLMGTGTCIFQ